MFVARYLVFTFVITLTSFFNLSKAQFFPESYSRNYAFRVKQLDEFISRFNCDSMSQSVKNILQTDSTLKIDKKFLLLSLFNHLEPSWDTALINKFIQTTIFNLPPAHLSFYDEDWYAEVNCTFNYKGKNETGSIILKNQAEGLLTSKWVIVSVLAPFLELPVSKNPGSMLNPVSNENQFVALFPALHDKANIKNYLSKDFNDNVLSVFVREVAENRLVLVNKNSVKYHFLQINNWIMIIEYYNRDKPNSGWLISKLFYGYDKKMYKKDILNL